MYSAYLDYNLIIDFEMNGKSENKLRLPNILNSKHYSRIDSGVLTGGE